MGEGSAFEERRPSVVAYNGSFSEALLSLPRFPNFFVARSLRDIRTKSDEPKKILIPVTKRLGFGLKLHTSVAQS
jgi:hypothetical protein